MPSDQPITAPASAKCSRPVYASAKRKSLLVATTGCVTCTIRIVVANGRNQSAGRSRSSTMPDAIRKRAVLSRATATARASQCWPHSTRSAFFALAGSPKPP
ncbi:hypothetical protein X977_5763 [Burkholderia pseudomallei MSHR7504]|nr:hypothetical protein X977_5763 [Burkholderia pseudomallei MSHR7504]